MSNIVVNKEEGYFAYNCDFCNSLNQKPYLWYYISQKRNQSLFFCSQRCKHNYYIKISNFKAICDFCSKKFIKRKSQIKKSKSGKSFCSSSCAAHYNNKLRRKSRRSKIEIKFYNMLVKEFPNLDILANDKTMLDGLEVDVAIPSLKLAIEWNGAVHFKPIYGKEKLDKVKQKDKEKLKIASNKNINLIVISDLVSNDKILKKSFDETKGIISNLLQPD
tara:strand:- start:16289 stop:16945 length:657 start_codon:yes stop_codon:yes gene_type:complete